MFTEVGDDTAADRKLPYAVTAVSHMKEGYRRYGNGLPYTVYIPSHTPYAGIVGPYLYFILFESARRG